MKRLVVVGIAALGLALIGRSGPVPDASARVVIGPRHAQHLDDATRFVGTDPAAPAVVRGYPMATPGRAREEAERVARLAVAEWLRPSGVEPGWTPPAPLLDDVVHYEPVEAVTKDYGVVYTQPVRLDQGERQRHRLVEAYERELCGRRLKLLAAGLAFVLTGLGVLVGYIHADEATRGYYTNQLRLAGAAGIGAAGYALYRLVGLG